MMSERFCIRREFTGRTVKRRRQTIRFLRLRDPSARATREQQICKSAATEIPELSNAELVHLRIRAIALENLVIVLLAQCSDQQLAVPREIASYIRPRPGFTHHPQTIHAASQMIDSVARAMRFRKLSDS
jgi:hypothetical protein